ncbi:MAG: glycosyltransferase family 4 protein [Gammaproteobacteria bacterium]|nr:glycosyltransferase family 4 protein [Gammaproteobacteria bacterium]MBV8308449.1 glycosyltransferase family 4 protein [Gammaproteobacteria bacterium]MBV8403428.1 glycosyltransferase family 4 protein [Gammaproteobacteria bacterium]
MTSVLVANLGAPEINRLGVELERRGVLTGYVRQYVNKHRGWEKALERAPGLGGLYSHTLGRRTAPAGLPLHKVVEAGVTQDMLAAAVGKLPLVQPRWRSTVTSTLRFAAERAVARVAGQRAVGADVVVASYGTGRYAFETVHRAGGRAVLSYPIAHNAFQRRLYAEEAALHPEFAAALPRIDLLPCEYAERLDIECALADRILVGSSFVRESFVALGHDARKIAVTPYGVDIERFAPHRRRCDGVFRVLFIGHIGQRKGVGYLLQGYELFRRPDCELHLVGDYVPGHEVYARYRHLYRHTPNLPQSDLPALFQEADVFVLPTLIEGMPLVVLEAMASGVPVITTTHGPGDVLRDGVDGFFVPIRDNEAIAQRLEHLYRDRGLREHMGRNAREQAARYTWDAYARRAADVVLAETTPEALVAPSSPLAPAGQ